MQNRIVGVVNLYHAEKGGVCCIGNIVVAPEARGIGVASFIVERMTDLAFERYEALPVQI